MSAIPTLHEKLVDFLRRQDASFASLPPHFVSIANDERSNQKDYNGRQVLELLQNAADAAPEAGSRVLIELHDTAVIVANTGKPLDWKGIESLVVAHNSPKQLDRNTYIGNRGLGFRSVLNWTNKPAILSGEIELHFDAGYAAERVAALRAISEDLNRTLEAYERAGHPPLIPILSYPKSIETIDATQSSDETSAFPELIRARQLRQQGYDTVVLLPFTESEAFEQALEQVRSLNEEIGLFVPQLNELRITADGVTRAVKVTRTGNRVEITRDEQTVSWSVWKERDAIPISELAPGQPVGLQYEVAVAIPDRTIPTVELWCYLPTTVRCNLPVRLHATLDLQTNRNNLREESRENRWILARLAKLLVRAAESQGNEPWGRLELITPVEAPSPELVRLGFTNELLEAAKSSALIPTIGKGFVTSKEATHLPAKGNFSTWLPTTGFEDVCPWREDDHVLANLKALGVAQMSATDLTKRLDANRGNYGLDQRARLISALLVEPHLLTKPAPDLLLLTPAHRAQGTQPILLPPTASGFPDMPDWAPIAFVDARLAEALNKLSGSRTAEDLAKFLGPFGVSEYRSETVASALVLGARNPPEKLAERVPALVHTLHAVWRIWAPSESAHHLSLVVPLLNRDGSAKDAQSLYFGDEYHAGRLASALLSWKGHTSFVATLERLGLPMADASVQFVEWCGVNRYPRKLRRNLSYTDDLHGFTEYQLDHPGGKLKFADVEYPASGGEIQYENFTVVEDLKGILLNAQPEAIISWLYAERTDSGSGLARLQKEGDAEARMVLRLARRPRYCSTIPRSFVHYMIRTHAWLKTAKGEPRRPGECIAGDAGELAEFLDTPTFDLAHPLFKQFGIEPDDVYQELRKAGASPSIADLSGDGIYRLIMRAEKAAADSDSARSINDALIGALVRKAGSQPTFLSINPPQWFTGQARMKGAFAGSVRPFPVGETVYVDEPRLVRPLADLYPVLLATPGQFDTQLVSKLLGCKVIRFGELGWGPRDIKLRPQSETLNASLRANLEHLSTWLSSQEPPLDPAIFAGVTVQLCEKLTVGAQIDGHEIAINWNAKDPPLIRGRTIFRVTPETPDDAPPQSFAQLVVEALISQVSEEPNPTLNFLLTTILLVPAEHVGKVMESIVPPRATKPTAPESPPGEKEETFGGLREMPTEGQIHVSEPSETFATNESDTPEPSDRREPAVQILASHDFEPQDLPEERPRGTAPPPGLVDATQVSNPPGDDDALSTEGDDLDVQHHEIEGELGEAPSDRRTPVRERDGTADSSRVPGWKRLGKVRGGKPRSRGTGKNWERLAFDFEAAQGRFPWAGASEYVGSDAFGCDLLSFATDDDRLDFVKDLVEGRHPDYGLVVRFVEVKGASAGDPTILPSPDQWAAAKRWGHRYYLYVFQPSATQGNFILSEISNPAAQPVYIPGIILSRTQRRVSTLKPRLDAD